ncbi:MAG TPA: tetratricopeptide repeat protein [Candidatus Polarisedimenticolia bacterium]|nr:tetratricopeptide repeat protein [Candidatus Polarisedimenticolia bacterium]
MSSLPRAATARIPGALRAAALAALPVLVLFGSIRGGSFAAGPAVARITSMQNTVESRPSGKTGWAPATVNQTLQGHDRVRTGAASRASLLYADQTLHRLNEKSEVEILPPAGDTPGVLKVLSGQHYFSSRTPKDFGKIETPTVTAAIKGTEFEVDVAEDSTVTITMLEGVVQASNAQGSLEVRPGEQAYVEPGKAPVRRTLVHPRDAVAWSFYYPPILGKGDAARLEKQGAAGDSLSRAATKLSAGQVDEAKPLVDGALKTNPRDPIALALSSVIASGENRREDATKLAGEAMAAAPDSAAAALAGSIAAQGAFDIDKATALARKASELDPSSGEAKARTAEMLMAQGNIEQARSMAEAAVKAAPGNARALSVLGFVELAEFNSSKARQLFEQAVQADSGLPLAHLGLGISQMRTKQVEKGRESLQTAATLDPADSLARSYLGKAYYEERRIPEAGKELATAKELDPNDPTPYLYDAILKQNDNRPLEALTAMQESIERNDRRAVYRSRLLLDQDTATRASDMARVYNDLGFEQLGMVTARRSADQDQANFSSHLFLSGTYRTTPNYAPAFLSEVLQARIFQPANVNAARPDVINESNVSFNEYTALFDRPRARAFGAFEYGQTDTELDEVVPSNVLCFPPGFPGGIPCDQATELDDSNFWDGNVTGTVNGDHYAGALSYRKFDDDGFRQNNDQRLATYRGFFEYSPGYKDSFQVNAQIGRRETGDQPLTETPALILYERINTGLTNVGFGWHRRLSPSAHLVVSGIYNDLDQEITDLFTQAKGDGTLKGPQVEAQTVFKTGESMSWIAGVGGFDGTTEFDQGAGQLEGDDTFFNGYGYMKYRRHGSPWEFTAGVAVESVDVPTGLVLPRNSGIGAAEDLDFSETKFSPKAGVSLYLPSKTTLRAAGWYRLAPSLGRVQTLEPTQISGFNQLYEEPGGTHSLSYGFGVDQEFGKRLFGGLSVVRRDLNIPQAYCSTEDPFGGCGFQVADIVDHKESKDDYLNAYVNAALGRFVSAGVEYSVEQYDFDYTRVLLATNTWEDYIETQRLRPQVRFYLPSGFFAGVAGTRYDQQVDTFDDFTSSSRNSINTKFWIEDLMVGYRFPKRYGSVTLQARNLGDREFDFYERTIQDSVIPARTVSLRVTLTY